MKTPTTSKKTSKCHCGKSCDCQKCKELNHSDEATGGEYLPDPNGGSVLLAWVKAKCRFAGAVPKTGTEQK